MSYKSQKSGITRSNYNRKKNIAAVTRPEINDAIEAFIKKGGTIKKINHVPTYAEFMMHGSNQSPDVDSFLMG